MAQYQLISDVDSEGYILKDVAIICIKDRETRHLKQGVALRVWLYQIGLAINIIAVPNKEEFACV